MADSAFQTRARRTDAAPGPVSPPGLQASPAPHFWHAAAWPLSHETILRLARAAIIAAGFLLLVGAAFLVGPQAPISARVPDGKQVRAPDITGRAAFPLPNGKTCRELVFDRVNGEIIDSKTAPCREMNSQLLQERTRAPRGFSWGGR